MVKEHGPVSREKIDEMLMKKLPDVLTEKQKKDKIHNLLSELSRNEVIRNIGTRGQSQWQSAANRASD